MAFKAYIVPYTLNFTFTAITSRDSMTRKDTYFLVIESEDGRRGIGECALFRGLSCDDTEGYEAELMKTCRAIESGIEPDLTAFPSIRFGYETAMRSIASADCFTLFPTEWSEGRSAIRINGLIWMGSAEEMTRRVREKIDKGFRCLKMKIGGVDFNEEISIIKAIRQQFRASDLELRLDANGSFKAQQALERLNRLSEFDIHSIEQPVKAGQTEVMARLCRESPIDIALDEELIGINNVAAKSELLKSIKPRYIILKPALVGGFTGSEEWIEAAEAFGIGWWATSALESNIGLNAIAQWCATKNPVMPQGLGTGQLYSNNIKSPLVQIGETLAIDPTKRWELPGELL